MTLPSSLGFSDLPFEFVVDRLPIHGSPSE
jgi:hypothetical protein